MSSTLSKHLPWIIPTTAVVIFGSGILDKVQISFGEPEQAAIVAPTSAPATATVAPAPMPAQPTAAPVVAEAPAPEPAPAPVPENAAEQLAILMNEADETDVDVSRNTGFSIDVLEQARDAALVETQAAAPAPVTNDFFAAAQANLANDRRCVDDLRILAAQTRVYFPSGGLTGDAAGIDRARVLGVLADQCPGVTLQVLGHSDPSGDPVINQRLSLERAQAVVTRITASGLDPRLFEPQGMGSSQPSGITGPQPDAFYDRRVEFAVIEATDSTSFLQASAPAPVDFGTTACVAQLRAAVEAATIEYAPRGMTITDEDEAMAVRLGRLAASCPEARLRVVGQHTDDPRAGENGSTGRLRAVILMGKLVNAGVPSDQVIVGAPSHPQPVTGLSDSRIDFQVILEEL